MNQDMKGYSMTAPNIVVLDGYTLNPGDLSWAGLEALGQVTVHDRTPKGDVVSRAKDASIVLTNKAILDRTAIENLPGMRYIGVMATGYNVVDLEAAKEHGIPVTNVPEYATPSVVQMVFALLFELAGHVSYHSGTVHAGKWSSSIDFCYWDKPLVELAGLTMGIVGYGRIGRSVAAAARAFGMNVIVHTRSEIGQDDAGIRAVALDDLFRESDVVSLNCPLNDATKGIINASTLGLMKKTAFLINTGRGPLIVDRDLAMALDSGKIAGAGLDVMTTEPPSPDNPLIGAKNCIITPHIAWATHAARTRLMKIVTENVRAFIDGRPVNVVNGVK